MTFAARTATLEYGGSGNVSRRSLQKTWLLDRLLHRLADGRAPRDVPCRKALQTFTEIFRPQWPAGLLRCSEHAE
jgi:hypothetical protein